MLKYVKISIKAVIAPAKHGLNAKMAHHYGMPLY